MHYLIGDEAQDIPLRLKGYSATWIFSSSMFCFNLNLPSTPSFRCKVS